MDYSPLIETLTAGEDQLMERFSLWVRKTVYIKYFPAGIDACRLTIAGLTEQIRIAAFHSGGLPEFNPEADLLQDALAAFGVTEAKRHRARGVTMTMFLGLLKYHRRSYLDYIQAVFTSPEVEPFSTLVDRCFDYIELSIVSEWSSQPPSEISKEMERANQMLTIKKNRYKAIFENLPHPIFLVDAAGDILNFNHVAKDCFPDLASHDASVLDPERPPLKMPWMRDLVREAIRYGDGSFSERMLPTCLGERIFRVYIKQTLDVGGRVTAQIISLADITERKKAEEGVFRLTRAYDVLSQTSQAIVRLKDADSLFDEVCRIAVQKGRLKIAIVNQVSGKNHDLKTVTVFGGDHSLPSLLPAKFSKNRPNISSLVIKNNRRYICNDIRKDPWLQARIREAMEKKIRSLAAFPLFCKNQLYGTLNLYAREKDFFTDDIVAVFDEMASDISFALDNFAREKQRQDAEERLWEATNKLQAIFKAAPLPVVAHTQSGKVLMWNPEAEKVFGWKEEELLHRPLPTLPKGHLPEFQAKNRRVFKGESIAHLQVQRCTRDGQRRDFLLFNTPLYDPREKVHAVMAILMDVTEQKRAQEQVAYLAHHDHLTRLPNRALLEERFELTVAYAKRSRTGLALCVLDLDGFKYVNDLLGHHKGDQLLCQIAELLQDSVRHTDTVCRLGGDEFLLLFGGIVEPSALAPILQKILEVFSTPFVLDEQQAHVTTSIGVALWGGGGEDFDTLFRHADAAMYYAKKAGGNNVQFFRQEIGNQIQWRSQVEEGVRLALVDNSFFLHFQPICGVSDNSITGAEALIRWEHPKLGMVPPDQFIPIAEEANLILGLGSWILEELCSTLRRWDEQGLPQLPIAVNISARQLFDQGFPTLVGRILEKYHLAPNRLELEITEGLCLENLESVETILKELKAIGLSLALDDFGTGYCSLGYLKRFPIDKLKIDRCFMKGIGLGGQDAVLAETIVKMAGNLGLQAVAEGVETEEQLAFLSDCRCDLYQGFLFARPMPVDAFASFWRASNAGRPSPGWVGRGDCH